MGKIFDDWNTEPEQEPFECPLCGFKKYRDVCVEVNKKKDETVIKASGLIKNTKARNSPDIRVTKDFAECLNCSNKTLLSDSEEVIPKETKKEAAEKLAQAKFKGHFLNPRPL